MRYAVYAQFKLDEIPMGEVVLGLFADQVSAFREQMTFEKDRPNLVRRLETLIGADAVSYGTRMLS